jgi:hypothetical protein
MGLLDGGGAALLGSVFSGVFLAATLHKAVGTDDGMGGWNVALTPYDIKVQKDDFSAFFRSQNNIPAKDAKFIVLQSGAGAAPAPDDFLVLSAATWKVVSVVSVDPAGATWVLHCTPGTLPA